MPVTLRRFVVAGALLAAVLTAPAADAATLAPATGLAATSSGTTATFTWTAVPGASSYKVCVRKTSTSTSCYLKSASTKTPTVKISGIPKRTAFYYFAVYAFAGSGHSLSANKAFTVGYLPSAPTGVTALVRSNNIIAEWNAASGAISYSLCVARPADPATCVSRSPYSSKRTARIDGLTPVAGHDYVYKVIARNSAGTKASPDVVADLTVLKITGVTLNDVTPNGFRVAWDPQRNAGTYTLQVSTTSTFDSPVSTTVADVSHVVDDLKAGTRYYARVRGMNDTKAGPWSTSVTQVLPTKPFEVRVMTYNLCGQDKCLGDKPASILPTWSKRKPLAGAIVRAEDPDVVATQESHSKDTNFGTQLPGFGLYAYKSSKSLFVRKDRFTRMRYGSITLDKARNRYAVWAEVRDQSSGSRVMLVDAHLEPYKGVTHDRQREAQTKALLAGVKTANTRKLPVIYAGDFNSNKSNANQSKYPGGYDAPLKVFTAAGIPDSVTKATAPENVVWNSANQAKNPPTKHSDHIDHVYITPDLFVKAWKVVITITSSGNYRTPFATDHNPVMTVVEVPAAPSAP